MLGLIFYAVTSRNSGEDGPAERSVPATSEPSPRRSTTTTGSQESSRKEGNHTTLILFIVIVKMLFCSPPLLLSSLLKGRKSQRSTKAAETTTQKGSSKKPVTVEVPKLKSQYGVDAWKRWIQWRQTQPNLVKPRFGCKSGCQILSLRRLLKSLTVCIKYKLVEIF